MTSATKRQKLKSPGRCVFCGELGVTKEHVFPQWLRRMVPRTPLEEHTRARNEGDGPIDLRAAKKHQGKALTTTIRCFCSECNGTWMSGIEASTKNVILPLMRGEQTTLSFGDQQQLATWLTLKTMIVDQIDPSKAVVSASERQEFRASRKPLDGWHIWLGKSEMKFGQCGFAATYAPTALYNPSTLKPITPEKDENANTVCATFYSGGFLGVAVRWPFANSRSYYQNRMGDHILIRLWPYHVLMLRSVEWPPEYMVTLGGIAEISRTVLLGVPFPDKPTLII